MNVGRRLEVDFEIWCVSGGRDVERQGSPPRCSAVCVLIRAVLQSSIWHFPSSPAPSSLSLFTWPLSDALLPTRLSSALLHSVDTGRLLRQSLASLTPVLLSSLLQSYMLVPSNTRTHVQPPSQSPPFKGSRRFVSCRIMIYLDVWLLCVSYSFLHLLAHDRVNWLWSMLMDKSVIGFWPCLFGLKLNRCVSFHSHVDKEWYRKSL